MTRSRCGTSRPAVVSTDFAGAHKGRPYVRAHKGRPYVRAHKGRPYVRDHEGRPYEALTSLTSAMSVFLASPKSIMVLSS